MGDPGPFAEDTWRTPREGASEKGAGESQRTLTSTPIIAATSTD